MTRSDPRYAGDDIDWTALQVARADVAQRFAVLFGDRTSVSEVGYDLLVRVSNGTPVEDCNNRSIEQMNIGMKRHRERPERVPQATVSVPNEKDTSNEMGR